MSVRVEHIGPMLRLTIDKPATRNALDDEMVATLIDALVAAGQDDAVRVIVLGSANEHFCSGADVIARNSGGGGERPRPGSIQRRVPSRAHRLVALLLETQTPVVAAVRGWAAGLGFQLALAADFCVASTTARFWEPFVGRGFTPDSGASWMLPRVVGLARARELLLLGRELSGEEAAAWGLIHAAVDEADVDVAVAGLAQRLAAAPTVAVGLTKWLLNTGAGLDLDRQLQNEALALELSSRTDDFREGLLAFREKRPPDFRGR